MAMGRRKVERQEPMFLAVADLATTAGHPFYERLNDALRAIGFDHGVEEACAKFYHDKLGRPGIPPGVYFRMLMIGYFEGIDSERGIAWRVSDSLSLRRFLGFDLSQPTPDHSSMTRLRQRLESQTHAMVFRLVLQALVKAGLVKGKTIGVDATTLEANAAMRSIVRKQGVQGAGQSYQAYLEELAKHGADEGDRQTGHQSVEEAFEHVAAATADESGEVPQDMFEEVVADKGYHSNESLLGFEERGVRPQISEPDRGRRNWKDKAEAKKAVYANRRRLRTSRGRQLQRHRGEKIERSNAHLYETGGMRRTHLRGHANILKRLIIHAAGYNLGLLMRALLGIGKPRTLQNATKTLLAALRAAARGWLSVWMVLTALLLARPRPHQPTTPRSRLAIAA
jgi:transposase